MGGEGSRTGPAGATINGYRIGPGEFDFIHSHCRIEGFPMAWRCPTPTLTTLQGRLDLPEYASAFTQFRTLPLVSNSDAQWRPLA